MSHAAVLVAIPRVGDAEELVAKQMAPFDESGDWFRDGSRWDWWQIGGRFSDWTLAGYGDVVSRAELDVATLLANRTIVLRRSYREAERSGKDATWRSLVYDVQPDETEDVFIQRKLYPIGAHAFLADRAWHENGRMGWFGHSDATTECEIATGEQPTICRFAMKDEHAQVLTYRIDADRWRGTFWNRFIDKLSGDTRLVVVDYHV